ncbi:MAG: DUF427 domain-containing protein [Acidimicrobiia bacterium]|nr:DUF427 domain-containing protein [Acidimicrobiia bacterium]
MQRESVWDYPRPPAVEGTAKRIRVVLNDVAIVDTTDAYRVLETSHPPVYYLPRNALANVDLVPNSRRTFCEFKGVAHYWDIRVGNRFVPAAAWSYPSPTSGYEALVDRLAFYPSKMDECWVGDQLATPQKSDFYGGWITPEIDGPFKS